ncbi:MAG TPA: HupE/UreJ family protein [Bacteroidetes bacterium]|nr:HupE/UreJ family protein [Bacteroidota bacterium]
MSTFAVYLELGFTHITDLAGYDHILFLLALCAAYTLTDWRRVLVLVTAFTIGHSFTLALSVLTKPLFASQTIEFFIPITIVIACIFNIFYPKQKANSTYYLALFFGLFHGMGFSNYLRMLLGAEESIIQPLFAFNIGLELGQILIVGLILSLSTIILRLFPVSFRAWTIAISIFAGTVASYLAWAVWQV